MSFTTDFQELLQTLKHVMEAKDPLGLKLKNLPLNPNLKSLTNYSKAYYLAVSENDSEMFQADIKALYDKYRALIQGSKEIDTWLTETVVKLPMGLSKGQENKKYTIMLSTIYNQARINAEEYEKEMETGAPMSDIMVHPTKILRCLYRMFAEIEIAIPEKKKLQQWIQESDTDLGVGEASEPNFMNTIAGMFSGNKIPFPPMAPGQGMPSNFNIGDVLGKFISNPKLTNALTAMTSKMENAKSMESAFKIAQETLINKEVIGEISSSLNIPLDKMFSGNSEELPSVPVETEDQAPQVEEQTSSL